MSDYPKMLYKGDQLKYEYQTAANEESEKEFHLKVIELIDEKMIHYKLREKYFEIFPEKFEEEEKEKNLKKLAAELGYKIEKQND